MMRRFLIVWFTHSGIRDIDVSCSVNNTTLGKDYFGDEFDREKDEETSIFSVNINGLRTEGWKVKNDQVRDFVLSTKADIVAFQETNFIWIKMARKTYI